MLIKHKDISKEMQYLLLFDRLKKISSLQKFSH